MYVLRLINILKYEIFFRDRKLSEIFWLHFHRETGKQCFHHIHVPYAPDTYIHTYTYMFQLGNKNCDTETHRWRVQSSISPDLAPAGGSRRYYELDCEFSALYLMGPPPTGFELQMETWRRR
jgi:hypothetical protein